MIQTAHTWWLLRGLRRGARRSPAALRDLQGGLLRAAVAHAYRHVSFYRRLWDEAGVRPASIGAIEDLERLPIITTKQVRAAAASGDLLADGIGANYPRFPTSGSSGTPLLVPRAATEARLWRAAGLRMLLEHGFTLRDATVQFDPAPGPRHPLQRLGWARSTWIAPTLPLDEQLAQLMAARASVVVGSPTALRRVCRRIDARRCSLPPARLVFCQGEILDRDSRAIIRRHLGADPINVYGMTEVGYVAWQCEGRAAFHVNADLVALELLGERAAVAPGELGRIVVTDLRGRTMPLLRWDTEDLAMVPTAPCSCRRTLPVIGPIEGRLRQRLVLGDGRLVTARAVLDHMAGTLNIDDYGLRQDGDDRFTLEVTPEAAAGAGQSRALRRVRELLGDVDVHIAVVRPQRDGAKTHVVTRA